jgi:alkylated DNA repair dioxygenase AlkB
MIFTKPLQSLPPYLDHLLLASQALLTPILPEHTLRLLYTQPLARQAILNLYPPGQGISPHIDLPNRYADGILGISLMGGAVMTFENGKGMRYDVYIPPRSVYVFTEEARWEWKHGIEGREEDLVQGGDGDKEVTLLRSLRLSVTFRWMKEGGDVLS